MLAMIHDTERLEWMLFPFTDGTKAFAFGFHML